MFYAWVRLRKPSIVSCSASLRTLLHVAFMRVSVLRNRLPSSATLLRSMCGGTATLHSNIVPPARKPRPPPYSMLGPCRHGCQSCHRLRAPVLCSGRLCMLYSVCMYCTSVQRSAIDNGLQVRRTRFFPLRRSRGTEHAPCRESGFPVRGRIFSDPSIPYCFERADGAIHHSACEGQTTTTCNDVKTHPRCSMLDAWCSILDAKWNSHEMLWQVPIARGCKRREEIMRGNASSSDVVVMIGSTVCPKLLNALHAWMPLPLPLRAQSTVPRMYFALHAPYNPVRATGTLCAYRQSTEYSLPQPILRWFRQVSTWTVHTYTQALMPLKKVPRCVCNVLYCTVCTEYSHGHGHGHGHVKVKGGYIADRPWKQVGSQALQECNRMTLILLFPSSLSTSPLITTTKPGRLAMEQDLLHSEQSDCGRSRNMWDEHAPSPKSLSLQTRTVRAGCRAHRGVPGEAQKRTVPCRRMSKTTRRNNPSVEQPHVTWRLWPPAFSLLQILRHRLHSPCSLTGFSSCSWFIVSQTSMGGAWWSGGHHRQAAESVARQRMNCVRFVPGRTDRSGPPMPHQISSPRENSHWRAGEVTAVMRWRGDGAEPPPPSIDRRAPYPGCVPPRSATTEIGCVKDAVVHLYRACWQRLACCPLLQASHDWLVSQNSVGT